MSEVDAAIERSKRPWARYTPPKWEEQVLADRALLAGEVVRLRDLQRAAIAYQGPITAEVERLRRQVAGVRQLATVAQQEQVPVPADLIFDKLREETL